MTDLPGVPAATISLTFGFVGVILSVIATSVITVLLPVTAEYV